MQNGNIVHFQTRRIFIAAAGAMLSLLSGKAFPFNAGEQGHAVVEVSQPVRRRHVYIIHGYMAKPSDHWFPWLEQRLLKDGFGVEVLSMPDAQRPNAMSWDEFLNDHISRHDEDTFFVAHSLGCISLLRHLAGRKTMRIGGIVLVSGFSEPVPGLPQLDEFSVPFQLDRIQEIALCRTVIAARDDAIVPYPLTSRLATRLQADFVTVDQGGHFLGSEGFTAFPLVHEHLISMMLRR